MRGTEDEKQTMERITPAPEGLAPAPAFDPPATANRTVRLRPLMPEDQSFLRSIELGPELGSRWRFRGTTPGPEQWSQSTWSGALAQFVIVSASTGEPLGLVSLYDVDFRDGVGSIAAAKFSEADRSLRVVSGILLFLEYAFESFRLRKLYFDVPEYNLGQFGGLESRLDLEARLKSHFFSAGRYWDRLTFALTREHWDLLRDHYEGLIR